MPGTRPSWRIRLAVREPSGVRAETSRRVSLLLVATTARDGTEPDAPARARARSADLRGRRIGLADEAPGGLLGAVEGDQPLAEERRRRVGIATAPARPHEEIRKRPVDRAAQPRLRVDRGELVGDELTLVLVGSALVERTGAVRLGAELADHDRLVGV